VPDRYFYLSFAGDEGFHGGCVVIVTPADVARLREAVVAFMLLRRAETGHLDAPIDPNAVIVGVAHQVAREHGCNPGGDVLLVEVTAEAVRDTGQEPFRLYSRAELEAFDRVVDLFAPSSDTRH